MKKLIIFFGLGFSLFAKTQIAIININGMTCPLCTMAIKKSLKKTNGVIKAKVKLNTKKATVEFDDKNVTKELLLNAIKKAGYEGKIISIHSIEP